MKRLPDGYTPSIYRSAAFHTFGRCDCIDRRHRSSFMGERESRPRALMPREDHVRSLDLPSRKLFLDVKVQTHEGKGQRDWLSSFIGVLRRERIHDVLKEVSRCATTFGNSLQGCYKTWTSKRRRA